MAIAVDQFVRQLVDSGLMSADEVDALIANLPADKKPRMANNWRANWCGRRS